MEPVKIELLMVDKLSGGLDKAGQSVERLTDRAKAAAALINAKIEEQHKVIDGVAADLERMERQLAGMKPGTAQRDLAADVAACRKVLAEEKGALAELEKQHRQAEKAVEDLAKEHDSLAGAEERSAASQQSLADRIAESKALIKGTQADIKELERAYNNAAPGNPKSAALAELNAARKALEEEKGILASLTAEQERNRESNKRLSMQLRELQDAMARMRLEGRQDSEEYRRMAAEAANLSDTISDLRTQTKILSNDDANLQGFMSGVSGLSGAFTAATGALSLFAGENENLAKIQTRVQSVMAITMGLQQVFNTLNKDSAFRLVTVVKMKNLLTAANTRLAAALGISTAAASALMATLTLGLSAAITGLIVLWDKYSDAQEEAARKAQEMVEIESDGRAEMIKTRFEIDNTVRSLKEFSGSKEEEKQKVEELNRKYGEAFGYYDTVAQWYDILIRKSEAYVQTLLLQSKTQALVNKAVEADEKVNKIKTTSEDDVEGSMGWFRKGLLYFAQAIAPGTFDAAAAIKAHNKAAKADALKAAEAERDEYLRQAKELREQAVQTGKDNGIGGHTKPESPKAGRVKSGERRVKNEHEREMAAERQRALELQRLRWENEQADIDQMAEGSERRIRQLRLDYEKETAEIQAQEAKWREAQKGTLTQDQTGALEEAARLAGKRYADGLTAIQEEMEKAEEQSMRDYLEKYGDYEERKLAISESYEKRIAEAQTDGARKTLEKELEAALADLDMEELKKGIDWEEVFGDLDKVSTEGLRTLRERLREYIETQKGLQPDGLKELVSAIGAIDEKVKERNPFDALRTSLLELQGVTDKVKLAQDIYNKTLKEGTKEEQKNAKATLDAARNARQKALAEATDAMHKTVGKVREYADAGEALTGLTDSLGIKKPEWLEDYLEGTGQMLDGLESIDLTKPMSVVTGGIKALSGAVRQLTSLGGVINWNGSNAKEVQATIERLTERNEILTDSIDRLTDELGKTGGMKAVSTAKKADEQQREKERNLLEMMEAQMGYHGSHHSWNYYWGGFSQKQIADFSEQIGRAWDGALTSLSADEAARLLENPDMVEAIKNAGKGGYGSSVLEKLKDYAAEAGALQEIEKQLNESLTQTSFDSLRDDFISSLSDMEKSAEDFSDDFTKMLMQSVLNAKIADLMDDELENFYQDWAERSKDGLSAGDIDALKAQWDDIVQAGMAIRDEVAGVTGYTGSAGGGKGQSGKSGGFSAMSQDQGTKLEGMFTSGLRHWASMDERMENVAEKMNTAEGYLARIEENTGKSAGHLETLVESFLKMVRDGLKVR